MSDYYEQIIGDLKDLIEEIKADNKVVYLDDNGMYTLPEIQQGIPDAWRISTQDGYITTDGITMEKLPIGKWEIKSLTSFLTSKGVTDPLA